MKVIFVLPALPAGGVERVCLTLIRHLQTKGITCCLALRRCEGELMEQGQVLLTIEELARDGRLAFIRSLASLIRREQPTHLVTAFSHYGIYVWLALQISRSQAKWVHSVHSSHKITAAKPNLIGHFDHWIRNRMAGFVYRRADAVVAVSEGVRQEILDTYRVESSCVIRIYNPVVPESVLQKLRAHRLISNDVARLVAMGRLVRQKGFDTLVRAMVYVPGSWQLDIWGEGPERGRLEQLIKQVGLQKRIALCGYTAESLKVMQGADIYIMSSIHEGLGNTLIEAMACQCQLISTDCPHGPREILEDGELGELVTPGDTHELAQAITHRIEGTHYTPPQKLARHAQKFSVVASCEKWEILLKRIKYSYA